MKKISLFCMTYVIILTICCVFPIKNEIASADIDFSSKSAILMEFDTKEILYEKNAHEKLPVASMVKMMTILLTLENIDSGNISLEDKVMTSENAAGMGGSQVFIDAYQEYKLGDLLKSVIVASANDGSVALAEYISGSENNFVKQMNRKAKELKMNDTNYINCTGLPAPEQYSSAYDSAIILSEIVKYDVYHQFSNIWMDNLVHPSGRVTELVNTNRLIKYFPGCDGGKTGSTNEAGCCLSASAVRDDMRLISVIVGAENSKTRFSECSSLFNYGFANFERKKLVNADESLGIVPVKKAKLNEIEIYPQEDYSAIVNKNEEVKYQVDIQMPKEIKGGIKNNTSVGKIIVSKEGEIIKEINIINKVDIEAMNYIDGIKKIIANW